MLKTYFRFRGESMLRASFSNLCYLSGTSKGKRRKKIVPCLLNHAKKPWAKLVTWELQAESLKRLVYFRIYETDEKKKLYFLFLRVISEVIFKSTVSEPIQMERSIRGVKDITEGWMKNRISVLLPEDGTEQLADHQITCKCNNLVLLFYKNSTPINVVSGYPLQHQRFPSHFPYFKKATQQSCSLATWSQSIADRHNENLQSDSIPCGLQVVEFMEQKSNKISSLSIAIS